MPFHPAVSNWLAARFGRPTEVQERAWAVTAQRRHALIAAPTGSGKTLAAFLAAINELVVEGLARGLDDTVQVLYVSPLKALSNDIRRNLQEPLAGIREQLHAMGLPEPGIRDALRTGDTPAAERERMRRTPPHILVTTPAAVGHRQARHGAGDERQPPASAARASSTARCARSNRCAS